MEVFISHASADKPTVRAIADALTDKNIEVWLDEARLRVGESIPEGVTAGLMGSDLLLLAFSQQALQSPWVKRELNAFFMIAMKDGKPIIPCRLDDSDPPALLADIKYADFRDDFTVGMTALLGAVGIAEEVADARTAAELAESVGASFSADERLRCYRTFVKQEMDYMWLLFTDGPSIFGSSEEPARRLIGVLSKSGLIEKFRVEPNPYKAVGDIPPFPKTSYRATPMGRRVFVLWGTEADGYA